MRCANGNPIRLVFLFSVIFGFAVADGAPATASEKGAQPEQKSDSRTTGQSADGPKDIRDVGEAGGGGKLSGEMRPLEGDREPATAIPGPSQSTSPPR
jgi:hypothetical protein